MEAGAPDMPFELQVVLLVLFVFLVVRPLARRLHHSSLWHWIAGVQQGTIEPAIQEYSVPSVPAPHASSVAQMYLLHADWIDILNNKPDDTPHLLVVGKTGSGKSTFVKALLTGRTGNVCVLTPKPEDSGLWGVPVVTVDADATYTTINTALDALYRELTGRTADDGQLTVLVDDFPIFVTDRETNKAAAKLITSCARLGRSRRMRLVLLTQETTAKAMGLEGQHGVINNLTRIDLQKHTHIATLLYDDDLYELDTRKVLTTSRQPWQMVPWYPPRQNAGMDTGISGTYQEYDDTSIPDEILVMVGQGLSANEIYRRVGGNRNTVLDQVRDARALIATD